MEPGETKSIYRNRSATAERTGTGNIFNLIMRMLEISISIAGVPDARSRGHGLRHRNSAVSGIRGTYDGFRKSFDEQKQAVVTLPLACQAWP